MASSSRIFKIYLGSPETLPDSTVILGAGSSGTVGAKQRLVHPDSENFPPLIFEKNPTNWSGMDNDVVPVPITTTVLTQGGTQLIRYERGEDDTLVTLRWQARNGTSMTSSFWRLLYEYAINAPPFDVANQEYITYEPRNLNDYVYNVHIVGFASGGDDIGSDLEATDIRLPTGPIVKTPLDSMETTPNGWRTSDVTLQLLIVGKVS